MISKHYETSTIHRMNHICNNRLLVIRICCIIFTIFLMIGLTRDEARAATSLKLYDCSTKKTTTYSDKLISATINGASVNLNNTPGILVNGVALLPYDKTFQNSIVQAKCTYNESKGTVSISKYNIEIVLTIGSKTATINGKKASLSVAPKKITYVNSKETKVLVPSRFVSEALGLGYTWYSDKNKVAITKSSMLLSYNGGTEFEYTGTKGQVTINGKKISLGSMPSIIVNNTAMLRASKVFAESSIGAKYQYNKADKTVTLTKNNITIKMTIGSKTAYVNKKKVSLSNAPMLVKNFETNITYVLVPGSFTATSLGYSYQWNNASRTSVITAKKAVEAPELGDSGDISETGRILGKWTADQTKYRISNNTHQINPDATATNNVGTIVSVSKDTTDLCTNSETFMIQATVPFNKITSKSSGSEIIITSDNEVCSSQSYPLYGTSSNLINTLTLTNQTDSIGTTISLNLITDHFSYDISLSADSQILYVTIYKNALTSAEIGTGDNGDYLILNGMDPLQASISEESGCINIDIPNTANAIGDLSTVVSEANFIEQFSIIGLQDRTRVSLTLASGYCFDSEESGGKLTLTFATQEENETVDTGDYNIVIPKPAGITKSMISDSDHYLSNYFIITLQGDYTSQLTSAQITNQASCVSKISVSLNNSGNTEIKFSTTKIQGYKITSDGTSIYVKVADPKDIFKNIVVLDPGHGGSATGAMHNGTYEKDLNFQILYTVGKKYFNQNPSKLKVYYTRTSDCDVPLMDRAKFASKIGADLFVSLHMNAAINAPSAKGTEVFYSKLNNSANTAGLTSQKLAGIILKNLYPAIGTSNRGVKEEALIVDKYNTVPAVLVELGFITNSTDYSIITDEAKQELAMESVYQSLLQIFDDYPTGR